jgi:hypothetical protein
MEIRDDCELCGKDRPVDRPKGKVGLAMGIQWILANPRDTDPIPPKAGPGD